MIGEAALACLGPKGRTTKFTDYFLLFRNRVFPFEPAEAREIRVGGLECTVVFHRQRSKVSIGDQIAHRISTAEHLLKDGPMLTRRVDDPYTWLAEPALHALDRFG